MKDFSLDIYRELLEALLAKGYKLISYRDYVMTSCRNDETSKSRKEEEKFVILRHDVDAKPGNSLKTAQIEKSMGARATYYFRIPEVTKGGQKGPSGMSYPEIVRAIVKLGHEIGYHYEDMSLCGGDVEQAWGHFKTWLEYFRQYYAVETICMHGAPRSKWDSKDLWKGYDKETGKNYDYKELGVIGEPYLDTDFSDVFYLTDTGRCWDGYKVSVRDRIPGYQEEWSQKGLSWHTTQELIKAVEEGKLPKHVMITTHPQRWTNDSIAWWKELVLQNLKNIIKGLIVG